MFIFIASTSRVVDVEINYSSITHLELFKSLRNGGYTRFNQADSKIYILDLLKKKYGGENWKPDYIDVISNKVSNFTKYLQHLWSKSSRNYSKCVKKNTKWFDMFF